MSNINHRTEEKVKCLIMISTLIDFQKWPETTSQSRASNSTRLTSNIAMNYDVLLLVSTTRRELKLLRLVWHFDINLIFMFY